MKHRKSLFMFLLFCIYPLTAWAELYKYVDKNGTIVFTDDASKVPTNAIVQNSKLTKPITDFLRGIPAPYSNDAFEKINSAVKDNTLPNINKNLSKEERMRMQMKMVREGFSKAGYGFDDTLIKVMDDMRYHKDRVPQAPSVAGMIIFILQGILENCKDGDFDCLEFFPPDSAEIIKSLIKGEKFK